MTNFHAASWTAGGLVDREARGYSAKVKDLSHGACPGAGRLGNHSDTVSKFGASDLGRPGRVSPSMFCASSDAASVSARGIRRALRHGRVRRVGSTGRGRMEAIRVPVRAARDPTSTVKR